MLTFQHCDFLVSTGGRKIFLFICLNISGKGRKPLICDTTTTTTTTTTRCYFNVRSKADISQLNLPHGSYFRVRSSYRKP